MVNLPADTQLCARALQGGDVFWLPAASVSLLGQTQYGALVPSSKPGLTIAPVAGSGADYDPGYPNPATTTCGIADAFAYLIAAGQAQKYELRLLPGVFSCTSQINMLAGTLPTKSNPQRGLRMTGSGTFTSDASSQAGSEIYLNASIGSIPFLTYGGGYGSGSPPYLSDLHLAHFNVNGGNNNPSKLLDCSQDELPSHFLIEDITATNPGSNASTIPEFDMSGNEDSMIRDCHGATQMGLTYPAAGGIGQIEGGNWGGIWLFGNDISVYALTMTNAWWMEPASSPTPSTTVTASFYGNAWQGASGVDAFAIPSTQTYPNTVWANFYGGTQAANASQYHLTNASGTSGGTNLVASYFGVRLAGGTFVNTPTAPNTVQIARWLPAWGAVTSLTDNSDAYLLILEPVMRGTPDYRTGLTTTDSTATTVWSPTSAGQIYVAHMVIYSTAWSSGGPLYKVNFTQNGVSKNVSTTAISANNQLQSASLPFVPDSGTSITRQLGGTTGSWTVVVACAVYRLA